MAHETATLIAEYQASGLTQKDFCSDKGIAPSVLQYHLSKDRKRRACDAKRELPASPGRFIPLQLQQAGGAATTVVIVRGALSLGELTELVRTAAA